MVRIPIWFLRQTNLLGFYIFIVMVQLFGGALCADFPPKFLDASVLRQIPDNQEVFLQDSKENLTVIIELLEKVEKPSDGSVAAYHFNSIAFDNDASQRVIWRDKSLGEDDFEGMRSEKASGSSVQGCQRVLEKGKRNPESATNVAIFVNVITLIDFQTDIVISVNAPLPNTSSVPSSVENIPPSDQSIVRAALETIQRVTRSLVLVDKTVFA